MTPGKRRNPGARIAAMLGCVLLLALANTVHGAPASAAAPPAITPAGSILQMLTGLVIVLLLLAGVVWILRRMGALRQQGAGAMRVVGAVAVGQRERVVLIEVAQTWLFVGVAPGSVNALHSMPKSAEVAPHSPAPLPQSGSPFASWLQRFIEGGNRAP